MSRGTRALISRSALQHNFAQVKLRAPSSKIWAVVKANAYGHGASAVAKVLSDADGFAVSTFDEGIALRNDGISKPIILLEGVTDGSQLAEVARQRFHCVVHCREQVEQIASESTTDPLIVWLKADTGMHRLGFSPNEVAAIRAQLQSFSHVKLSGIMTHLACADDQAQNETTNAQVSQFQEITQLTDITSIGNSAGIIMNERWHGDWVRPGIMLYGATPVATKSAASLDLQAVMTFQSPVIAVRRVQRGEGVGYGHRWHAPRDSVIATLAAGYGDGYPRHAPDGTPVWVNGQIAPLVGRVSMDMLMIDVTDLAQVQVGDMAELWGEHLPVDQVASAIDTIGYELLTRLSGRVPLEFVD